MAGFYENKILPRLLDAACGMPQMTRLRERYVSQAVGKVLEIGIGSGLNLPHYTAQVTSITGIDPAAALTAKAAERAAAIAAPVEVLGVSGEQMPCENQSFDTVVCTWTLCSIPEPEKAVSEMRRVLRPGGKLLFVEHGRSDEAGVARWQRRIEPLWKKLAGGCHLTRRPEELLSAGGFTIGQTHTGYEPGPKIAAFMIHGEAS
ncbi:MAG: class I SAM-dependent methyltransferase [Pseudomonadales bacterium]